MEFGLEGAVAYKYFGCSHKNEVLVWPIIYTHLAHNFGVWNPRGAGIWHQIPKFFQMYD